MDRQDLVRAEGVLPKLPQIWSRRVERLESQRQQARAAMRDGVRKTPQVERAELYHTIDRCDRSIAFLDRALVHLDDLRHGTDMADHRHAMPLVATRVQNGRIH